MRLSVRNNSSARRRRGHRTHDSVDGVAAADLFYGDLASSSTADYRALGLSELRRGTVGTPAGVSGVDTGCASCLSCDPGGGGKQRAVVCTVQNTRTATLVHHLDAAPAGTCGQRCQYGYATDDTGRSNGRPRTPGRGSAYASKQEIYCHSPYCIYATSGTSRRLQTFKSQAIDAPDVANYGSGQKGHQKEEGRDSERLDQEEPAHVDRALDQVGDRVDLRQMDEARGSHSDEAERWLRAADEEGERPEPAEAGSRRTSEASSPPSPTDGVTSRPVADMLDILGLGAPTPPTATSVDGRRVVNGLYNDHISNNNYNNNNNNNNSVTS